MWIVKKTKRVRHKCNPPRNWFFRSFDIGSIWTCDGCECAYLYVSGMFGDTFWAKYESMATLLESHPELNEIEFHKPEIASG